MTKHSKSIFYRHKRHLIFPCGRECMQGLAARMDIIRLYHAKTCKVCSNDSGIYGGTVQTILNIPKSNLEFNETCERVFKHEQFLK